MPTQLQQLLQESQALPSAGGEQAEHLGYLGEMLAKWSNAAQGADPRDPKNFLGEGIMDPFTNRFSRERTLVAAALFEQQAKSLTEAGLRGADLSIATKFLLPLMMRTWPQLAAFDLFSVQPLRQPVGAAFILDILYGDAKGDTAALANTLGGFDVNYSAEFIDSMLLATGDGAKYGGAGEALAATLGQGKWLPVRKYDSEDPDIRLCIKEVNGDGETVQIVYDNGSGGFSGDDASAGTINYTTGAIAGFKFAVAVGNGNTVRCSYYYDSEGNANSPQIKMANTLHTLRARSRRLGFNLSAEGLEDLRNIHGEDGEALLMEAAAGHIRLEIDHGQILNVYNQATYSGTWDADPNGVPPIDHYATILMEIDKISGQIYGGNLRAPANWIICGTQSRRFFNAMIRHANYMAAGPQIVSPDSAAGAFSSPGIMRLGTVGGYTIYCDPLFRNDKMLIGYKGPTWFDAGHIIAPYVPLVPGQAFRDPRDFLTHQGVRTRLATKLVKPGYYGVLTIQNG